LHDKSPYEINVEPAGLALATPLTIMTHVHWAGCSLRLHVAGLSRLSPLLCFGLVCGYTILGDTIAPLRQ